MDVELFLAKILLPIASLGFIFGLSYYFFFEKASICSYEVAEGVDFDTPELRQSCECRGFEVERENTLEEDTSLPYRETVCLGTRETVTCYEYLGSEIVEKNCENERF